MSLVSNQMLRLYDLLYSRGQQMQSAEYLAMQEFNQIGAQQYSKFNQINYQGQTMIGGGFG